MAITILPFDITKEGSDDVAVPDKTKPSPHDTLCFKMLALFSKKLVSTSMLLNIDTFARERAPPR